MQQTVVDKEFANQFEIMYRIFSQQQATNNPETAPFPRNIIINREQTTTPLTTKTTTGNVAGATDTSTIDRPRRSTRQELDYEEDEYIEYNLGGTVPTPLPTKENLSDLAQTIRKSEFGKVQRINDLKHPIEVIIAYITYILYIIGKGTSSNVKLEKNKDTWITSFKARHHIINGFYAAYNLYKDVDEEGKKNVHMTDVENGFVALLSLIRATAYGFSDQTFLTKMSGEPQSPEKWKELYKRLVGISPIQDIEYFIVRYLKGEEGGRLKREAGEFGPKWRIPREYLSCLKNERAIFQAINALPPGVRMNAPIIEEDDIDKERANIIKWDRYKTVPKAKKGKTKIAEPEPQPAVKRTRSGEKQQSEIRQQEPPIYDLQGQEEAGNDEPGNEDDDDSDRSNGSVKTVHHLDDNDEQMVAQQLVQQAD